MNIVEEATVPEKILLAAHYLEEHGQSPFSAESLIVASWQKFPKTFGLKGYADQYPDSNKVLSCIMGERGLARRGWLSKMGQKLYALTREGRLVVQRLLHGGEEPTTKKSSLRIPRDQEKVLQGVFGTSAVKKFEEGLKDEITFKDACNFWGIPENVQGEALGPRLDRFRAVQTQVERLIGTNDAELSNGQIISKDDTNLLTAVHEYLEDRFSRHLRLLRDRVVRN